MAGKIEIANNLGTQQRYYVRTNGKFKSRENLFRASGAAEDVAALKDQNFFSGFGEVGSVGEAIVTSADYDYVIL
jgi:hypothetical protein